MMTMLAATALAVVSNIVNPIFLPVDTVVEAVTCEEWQPHPDDLGERAWRADFGAVITVYDAKEHSKHIPAGDVTHGSAPDLWQQLEFQCAPEYGAGIGNAFQGEAIASPQT